MGYRSTFVTSHENITWPDWFVEKYAKTVHFMPDYAGVISSKVEGKFYGEGYGMFADLLDDIGRAIDKGRLFVAVLGEDGAVTHVEFENGGRITTTL